MRRTIATMAGLVTAAVLAGCGGGGESEDPATSSAPAQSPATSAAEGENPGLPTYGEPYETLDGAFEITVAEPEPVDISDFDMGNMQGVQMAMTVTNNTDAPVDAAAEFGYETFSGTGAGEYLICPEGKSAPSALPPGRTAEWVECFAVEDRDDLIFTVYPPSDLEDTQVTYGVGP